MMYHPINPAYPRFRCQARLIFSSARSMAARASSAESCEPAWIWRFRNFSAITRSAER